MNIEEVIGKIEEILEDKNQTLEGRSDESVAAINLRAFALLRSLPLIQILRQAKADRAVVEKLPKTADGVPVIPEMKLYRLNRRPDGSIYWSGEGDCIIATMAAHTGDFYDPHEQDWEEFFSTREAAIAALPKGASSNAE